MSVKLEEGDTIPLACRHCSSAGLLVTVKEGSWVRECAKCKGHTVVKVERRTGRWEIHTGTVGKGPAAAPKAPGGPKRVPE
jgi:hypothetical protein